MNESSKINQSKINRLMQEYLKGLVLLSSWLVSEGYPYELQQQYRKSGWLKSIGNGAMLKSNPVDLVDYQDVGISIKISSPARAMMECLSLCPNDFFLTEAYELMEGLSTLRPKQVQKLLDTCKSIKVKRLFLYFSERAGHSWFKYIDKTKIDLGSGNRSLANPGVLVPEYNLVLPKELLQ